MAKALVLSEETLAAPVAQPRAAQAPRVVASTPEGAPIAAPKPVKAAKAPKSPQVPLQIRIGAGDAKAIKRAALEADQTISDFLLACFHKSMKA
jgi:hypothetical protein